MTREYTEIADERELTLLAAADAYEAIESRPWGIALEVMRLRACGSIPEEAGLQLHIATSRPVLVAAQVYHPGAAHMIRTVMRIDHVDPDASWWHAGQLFETWQDRPTLPSRSVTLVTRGSRP